ncbi:MAG TPA: hypothetical protein VNB22_17995 [Pyrinomonadaceae bacterium]|jgi:hypothetical protein|nr:hypothetical protein [Pyrinomonadaceae bacterium]
MNNLSVKIFMMTALLCGVFFLANCSSAPATNSKTATVSTDSVGVPECDEYIKKYEACLTKIAEKAPQAQPGMKTAFEQQRNAFKQGASTEQGKATLATTCKQAIESAKQSTTAYGCAW